MSRDASGNIDEQAGNLRVIERLALVERAALLTFSDAIAAEVEGTVDDVRAASETMRSGAGEVTEALGRVTHHSRELEASAGRMTASSDAVAVATTELTAAVQEVSSRISQAARRASEAVQSADRADTVITALRASADKVGDVVRLIQKIASQTNLLALNATIEAARAGDAGRGFAVVANEVKTLSRQTADATEDITRQVQDIRQAVDRAVQAIGGIRGAIEAVEEYSSAVAASVEQQVATVGEIDRNARAAADETRLVGEAIAAVAKDISDAGERTEDLASRATEMGSKVGALKSRLKSVTSEAVKVDSHQLTRVPVPLVARLEGNGTQCRLIDLGPQEAILEDGPADLAPGRRIDMDIPAFGRLQAEIRSVEKGRAMLRLIGNATAEAIAAFNGRALAFDQPLIEIVTGAANRVSELFEEALRSGRLTEQALFDENYIPVPGSSPQQHMTQFVALTDAILPALQEPILERDPRIVFCAAIDRNGYLPTHNLRYNKPQGSDPVWNAANCRNRRIFGDRTGLMAGRNTQPFLVQSYLRDMGGNNFVLMKDLSAPVRVRGRHWGGFRMGYKPIEA